MAKMLYITKFHDFVCQQTMCPTGMALGRIRAGKQGELGFQFASHFARRARPHGFVGQDRLQPLREKAAADIANGIAMTAQQRGDLVIRSRYPLRAVQK